MLAKKHFVLVLFFSFILLNNGKKPLPSNNSKVPTPHINAQMGAFAKTVLMPGDPKRSEYIAKKFLENPVLVNNVRGVQGYTGSYKGKQISVMASGMGIPSISIYAYELYNFYNVENIIRVGSAGAIHEDLNVKDIVVGTGVSTNSNVGKSLSVNGQFSPTADFSLLSKANKAAKNLGLDTKTKFGPILTSDIFYTENPKDDINWSKVGIYAVEMEAYGLYLTAARSGKKALTICTISDDIKKNNFLKPEERVTAFDEMITLALETAILEDENEIKKKNESIQHIGIGEIAKETEVFLLDMDGTLYFDETPIGDMINTLKKLRAKGKKLVYLTNNSSKSLSEYVKKLKKIGFYNEQDLIYTSGMATCEYINEFYPKAKVYLVGTEALKSSFKEDYNINLIDDNDENVQPDICVLAYDTTLDFNKLKKINKYIVKGCKYIATHPDAVCPSKDVFPPDVGSFIALLKVSSGKEPDLIVGKPYTIMGDCIMRKLNVTKNKVTMVGDRLHTDIRFGNNNGFHSLLVLSGETTMDVVRKSPDRAQCIIDSLNDIVGYL